MAKRAHPGKITNARGIGTFLAIDGPTAEVRDAYIHNLKQIGVHAGVR